MIKSYILEDFKVIFEKDSSGEWGIHFESPNVGVDEYAQIYSVRSVRDLIGKICEISLREFQGERLYFYGFCNKRHRIFGKFLLSRMNRKINLLEGSLDGDTFVFEII